MSWEQYVQTSPSLSAFNERDFILLQQNQPADFLIDAEFTSSLLTPLQEAMNVNLLPPSKIDWEVDPLPQTALPSGVGKIFSTHEKEDLTESDSFEVFSIDDYNANSSTISSPLCGNKRSFEETHSSDQQNLVKEISTKKRKLTPEEKIEKRKQQTRAASKLYRQRRKGLEQKLLAQLEKLEKEKKEIVEKQQLAQQLLQNLKEENEALRKQQMNESQRVSKERLRLLRLLEQQVQENADDKTLLDTINAIKVCCGIIMKLGQCHLELLLSPSVVHILVKEGFFEADKDLVDSVTRNGGLNDIISKIKAEVKSLSPEQNRQFDNIIYNHYRRLDVIYAERREITQQFVNSFNQLSTRKAEPSDHVQILKLTELLRQSLSDENEEWFNTIPDILDRTLSPRQMAEFLLKIEFQHLSIRQLKNFWDAIHVNRQFNF